MDVFERRLLRRKRPILADTMGFSIQDQKKYMIMGLLNDTMMADIMVEQTEFGQMFKFLDLLTTKPGALLCIYDMLEDKDLTWMVDEMKAEIKAERGDLQVEEYVYREAGMMVHRQFGDTTTIPELAKKEIQLLLAIRYQTGKEAWQKNLIDTQLRLEEVNQWKIDQNTNMKHIIGKITTFLRIQQKHVNDMVHDMYNPPELLKEDGGEADQDKSIDYFNKLELVVDHLLEVLARILLERENLTDERKRCLQILNISRPAIHLDTILNYALHSSAQDATLAKREADLSDKLAVTLDSRMKSMRFESDRDITQKERQIAQLNMLLKDKVTEVNVLQKHLIEQQQRWEDAKEEMVKWKRRCEILEKTRRLGYYTPGWYDKLYDIDGIDYGRDGTPPPLVQTARTTNNTGYTTVKRTRPLSAVNTPSKNGIFLKKNNTGITFKKNTNIKKEMMLEKREKMSSKLSYNSSQNC